MPDNLIDSPGNITKTGDVEMARFRTAEAREWMMKAKELIDQEEALKSSLDCHGAFVQETCSFQGDVERV